MAIAADNEQIEWRGHSMDEIYRNLSPWNYNCLPPIQAKRDHSVLYELPWLADSSTPPQPRDSALKWDADHVRLPCSPRNEYIVKDDVSECDLIYILSLQSHLVLFIYFLCLFVQDDNQLHTVKKRWDIIEIALLQPIESSRELEKAILSYNTKYALRWKFDALHALFEEVSHLQSTHSISKLICSHLQELEEQETNWFFSDTLPAIIRLALRLPELVPCAIPLLKHGVNKSISLSQQQVACLLANAFLCTFPRRNTLDEKAEYKNYPSINFNQLFQLNYEHVLEKIKCICSYFRAYFKKGELVWFFFVSISFIAACSLKIKKNSHL